MVVTKLKPMSKKILIDKYCTLRTHIDRLKKSETLLRTEVLKEFDKQPDKLVLHGHDNFAVRKLISQLSIINPVRFANLVRPKDFYNCVTVGVSKARQFLAPDTLAKISTPIEKVSLKIKI